LRRLTGPAAPRERASLADTLVRAASHPGAPSRALLGDVVAGVAALGRPALSRIVDLVVEVAARLPLRDASALSTHHGGLVGDALAESLVTAAARTTAAIGAAGGALAAVEYAAPPTLLGLPAQVLAETLLTVAVELKLVAELHAVYDVDLGDTAGRRAASVVVAWSRRTGVRRLGPAALSGATRRELQRRLLRRFGRMGVTAAPLLTGAVAGAALAHRETKKVGEKVAADLRKHHPLPSAG